MTEEKSLDKSPVEEFSLSYLDVWSYTRKEFDTVKFAPLGRGETILNCCDNWGGFFFAEEHGYVENPIGNGRILRVGFLGPNGEVKNMGYAWFLRKGKPKVIDGHYNPLEEKIEDVIS